MVGGRSRPCLSGPYLLLRVPVPVPAPTLTTDTSRSGQPCHALQSTSARWTIKQSPRLQSTLRSMPGGRSSRTTMWCHASRQAEVQKTLGISYFGNEFSGGLFPTFIDHAVARSLRPACRLAGCGWLQRVACGVGKSGWVSARRPGWVLPDWEGIFRFFVYLSTNVF